MTTAPITCFRDQLAFLDRSGHLVRVRREVDPRFELCAVTKRLDPGPALLFERVKGYSMPVCMAVDGARDRIAASLGTTPLQLIDRYSDALANPLAPVEVEDGPVQERVITGEIDLMRALPILTHYEKDGGPYVTTGLVVAEDPARGVRNASYHRLQVTGPDELRALLLPRHLRRLLGEYEERDRPLPVAIVIGCDTAQRLAAATWGASVPLELDEFAIAGALKGQPERLVLCRTSGIRVPADAEIVIEGELLPNVRGEEGPYAEFTGNYGRTTHSPIIKVKAITMRQDPIYQGLLAFTSEHLLLLGMPYEPVVLQAVRGILPEARAVNITPGGCGKFHVVVQIRKKLEGDGKDAIMAALYAVRDIKLVTVVDDDVDPFDPRDVEWAMATRFQADRDLVVVSGGFGNVLDPSNEGRSVTAKMGIDATKPVEGGERFVKAEVPGAAAVDLGEYLQEPTQAPALSASGTSHG